MWHDEIEVVHWFKHAYDCPVCDTDCVTPDNLFNHLKNCHPYSAAHSWVRMATNQLEMALIKKHIPYLKTKGRIEFRREGTPP